MKRTPKAKPTPKNSAAFVREMRAELLLTAPFFGFLALKLKLVEDGNCNTMWTDGTHLGYSPDWVLRQSRAHLKGVIVHEVLHVIGRHPWRKGNREHERWNEACDYAINPLAIALGFHLPPGVLLNKDFRGMSAEAIYLLLESPDESEGKQQTPPPGPGQEGGSEKSPSQGGAGDQEDAGDQSGGEPASKRWQPGEVRPAPTPSEGEGDGQLLSEADWDQAIVTATLAQGKVSAGLERFVQAANAARMPWKELLWDFVERSVTRQDYVWMKPAPRYVHLGLYLPALEGQKTPPLVFVADTSASVPNSDLAKARQFMQEILDDLEPEALYVLYCDAEVTVAKAFYPGDVVDVTPRGGGGTDFRPAFKWTKEHAPDAAALIYLSDLEGKFPEATAVEIPTLWLVTSNARSSAKGYEVPFGQTVQLPAD